MKFQNQEVEYLMQIYFKTKSNILLIGPSGTGKTMVVQQTCEQSKRKLVLVTGGESMQDTDLFGSFSGKKTEGGYEWVDGHLTKAFASAAAGTPTTFFMDEMNRWPTQYQNSLIEAINCYDEDNYVVRNHQLQKTLKAPRDMLQFIATANIGQAGTNDIPQALKDRFNIVRVNYPDMQTELKILKGTGLDDKIASILVTFANETRTMADKMEIPSGISTRALVNVSEQYTLLSDDMPDNQKMNLLYVLMKSPVYRVSGACDVPDAEETTNGLLHMFEEKIKSILGGTTPGRARSRNPGAGIGANPAAI